MDQNGYLDNVNVGDLQVEREMQKNEDLNLTEQKTYRSLVGSLNWIVQGSRPDLAFALIDLSPKLNKATVEDLVQVMKIIHRAKNEFSGVFFSHLSNLDRCQLVVFADASHGNLCNGTGSCVGFVVFLCDDKGLCCPISWRCGKARRVVKSTIAAEAMALLDGMEEAIYLRQILLEMIHLSNDKVVITCVSDHKGLVESLYSTKLVEDRRLRLDVAIMKEYMEKKNIQRVFRCASSEQLADCLTKKGADGRKLVSVLQQGKINLAL